MSIPRIARSRARSPAGTSRHDRAAAVSRSREGRSILRADPRPLQRKDPRRRSEAYGVLSLPPGPEAILLDPSRAQSLLLLRLWRQGLCARLRRPDRECIDPRGGRAYRTDLSDTARRSGAAETEANAKRPRRRFRSATATSAVSAHARSIASIPGRKAHQS